MTRFLVVLTDVRPWGGAARNERTGPERRRQVVGMSSREAADRIAGAFMSLGMVRAGRQRVKIIAVGRRMTPAGLSNPVDRTATMASSDAYPIPANAIGNTL